MLTKYKIESIKREGSIIALNEKIAMYAVSLIEALDPLAHGNPNDVKFDTITNLLNDIKILKEEYSCMSPF